MFRKLFVTSRFLNRKSQTSAYEYAESAGKQKDI